MPDEPTEAEPARRAADEIARRYGLSHADAERLVAESVRRAPVLLVIERAMLADCELDLTIGRTPASSGPERVVFVGWLEDDRHPKAGVEADSLAECLELLAARLAERNEGQ